MCRKPNIILGVVFEDVSLANQIRATEENLWALWQRFGLTSGGALHNEGGALWFDTVLTFLPYNGVLRFQPNGDPEPLVDRIFAHYAERGVPFMWVVHPSTEPSHLSDLLEARGMTLIEQMPGMTMDLANLPPLDPIPDGVEVREATSEEELTLTQELIAWRWHVPEDSQEQHLEMALSFGVGSPGSPMRCWLALIDGKPVSKALLNLDAGSAGIHGVATKPEARGKGLARILTLNALQTARESGYRIAMLHSSPMARSLYEKIGFRQVSEFRVYASGGTFHV